MPSFFRRARQPEVEVRAVGQDGQIRPLLAGGADHFPVSGVDPRDMVDHFQQPHHGQGFGLDHRPDPRGAHSGAGAAEELRVRQFAPQSLHQERGVQVTRGFAGGNQDLRTHYGLVYQALDSHLAPVLRPGCQGRARMAVHL